MDWYHLPFAREDCDELLLAVSPHSLDYLFGLLAAAASVPRDFDAKVVLGIISKQLEIPHRNRAVRLLVQLFDRVEADLLHHPALVAPDYEDPDACADWASGYLRVLTAAGMLQWPSRLSSQAVFQLTSIATRAPGAQETAEWLPVISEQLLDLWRPTTAAEAV